MIFRDCLIDSCEKMGVVEFSGRYYCTDCFIEYCVMRESKTIFEGLNIRRKSFTNNNKELNWLERLLIWFWRKK